MVGAEIIILEEPDFLEEEADFDLEDICFVLVVVLVGSTENSVLKLFQLIAVENQNHGH